MSHLTLAIILIIAVACVIAATQPAAPRRRRTMPRPSSGRERADDKLPWPGDASGRPKSPDRLHRNRWDRTDLLRGVGRDDAAPEMASLLWPAAK